MLAFSLPAVGFSGYMFARQRLAAMAQFAGDNLNAATATGDSAVGNAFVLDLRVRQILSVAKIDGSPASTETTAAKVSTILSQCHWLDVSPGM